MFKRNIFSFIVDLEGVRHEKQNQALRTLTNDSTVEFLYGGAAGGAKSWTGCVWLLFSALAYPNTHWFIGREELKRLRESTLLTFYKVCSAYGAKKDTHWKYNGADHFISFSNGSRITLIDLRYLPSDPLYERYGSMEFTGGWIEEGGEVNFGAYDTLKTRIGRQANDIHGILRKLFITCNPKKNWMYSVFYKPAQTNELPPDKTYLSALVQDNPFIDKGYISALQSTQDKVKRERLLKGNWDYDDNPNALCSYDDIMEIFHSKPAISTEQKYLTADIARFGADKARIAVWHGWNMIERHSFATSSTTQLQSCILAMITKHNIPRYRCIADEDGVGGGVVDNCKIVGFVNGSKALGGENFQNLQTQCAYFLAHQINTHSISISCALSEEEKECIAIELSQLETYQADSDGKLKIKPKEQIKADIGRSPDWRDTLLMRAYFEFVKERKPINTKRLASAI